MSRIFYAKSIFQLFEAFYVFIPLNEKTFLSLLYSNMFALQRLKLLRIRKLQIFSGICYVPRKKMSCLYLSSSDITNTFFPGDLNENIFFYTPFSSLMTHYFSNASSSFNKLDTPQIHAFVLFNLLTTQTQWCVHASFSAALYFCSHTTFFKKRCVLTYNQAVLV